ncbi:MAG: hypothetical protein GY841_12415 [FCB group bacterium]|nr:hypothetical protein [FCB group bacterium]
MEQSFILWTDPETGRLTVTSIPYDREDAKAFWVKRVVPDGVEWCDIHPIEIPADRTFRNAWKRDLTEATKKIRVSMTGARKIHMDRIRHIRNQELKKEDILFQMAIEENNETAKAEIASRKKALRDLPDAFDLDKYETPAELKEAWPEELPEPDAMLFRTVFNT